MSGRYSARGVDKDPGWVERRFREHDQRLAELSTGKLSAVPGSVVTIQQVLTDPAGILGFVNTDTTTATGPGQLQFQLTYTPRPGSLQVWWAGLPQPPTEWSLSGNVVTIPDPNSVIKSGQVFTAYYAHDSTEEPITTITPTGTIDWGSTGPNLVVAEGDTTDLSAVDLDESGWTTAAGPAGFPLGENPVDPSWPDVVFSTVSTNAGVWLRRDVGVLTAATFTISARVDGEWWLYLDGTLIDSDTSGTAIGPYVEDVAAGSHVVALHVNDDASDPGSDYLYADVRVEVS